MRKIDYEQRRKDFFALHRRLGCPDDKIQEWWQEKYEELKDHELNDKEIHLKGYLKVPFDRVVIARSVKEAKAQIAWDFGGDFFSDFRSEDLVCESVEINGSVEEVE